MRRPATSRPNQAPLLLPGILALFLGLFLALPAPAPAAGEPGPALSIDTARSEARFFLKAPRHGVEGRSRALEGSLELGGGGLSEARGARARLAAASLHAGNRLIDRNMRGALDADRHPEIVFEATSFEPGAEAAAPAAPGSPWRGVVRGDLTVRGVTRPVAFDVEATRRGEALEASGSTVFKLTDFGIDPPRFLGFLRVKDWVRVEFDVVARPPAAPIASPPEAP